MAPFDGFRAAPAQKARPAHGVRARGCAGFSDKINIMRWVVVVVCVLPDEARPSGGSIPAEILVPDCVNPAEPLSIQY